MPRVGRWCFVLLLPLLGPERRRGVFGLADELVRWTPYAVCPICLCEWHVSGTRPSCPAGGYTTVVVDEAIVSHPEQSVCVPFDEHRSAQRRGKNLLTKNMTK